MEITYSHKGRTQKVAEVAKIVHENDEEILAFVLSYFGESRDRIFGWNIRDLTGEGEVRVYLYID